MDTVDGEVWLTLGGSGGSRIFGSVAQVIMNLDWGYDVSNAIEQQRVHDQLSPAYVSLQDENTQHSLRLWLMYFPLFSLCTRRFRLSLGTDQTLSMHSRVGDTTLRELLEPSDVTSLLLC